MVILTLSPFLRSSEGLNLTVSVLLQQHSLPFNRTLTHPKFVRFLDISGYLNLNFTQLDCHLSVTPLLMPSCINMRAASLKIINYYSSDDELKVMIERGYTIARIVQENPTNLWCELQCPLHL